MTAKAVTSEVGIATNTISEFRILLKNKSITSETSITARVRSNTTEFTAAMVLSVESSAMVNFTPAVAYCFSIV
jgi:hypothetical protein